MAIEEEWRRVIAFSRYEASNLGVIRFAKTGRELHPTKNQHGLLKVNLTQNGEYYTRAVNHIVAKLYIDPPRRDDFISIIHLDGNKSNCRADNLQWRPRYFAVRYHLQFGTPFYRKTKMKVEDITTGVKYDSIQDAVVQNGLLLNEILMSVHERTYVWPTYQEFRAI